MKWEKALITGVEVKKLTKYLDSRGFLCETFRLDKLQDDLKPVMSYISYTEPGIVRGPHEHVHQTDIFSFIGPGNFSIKVWDNRKESSTYGKFMVIYGGVDNPITVIVPPGVVHGYKNISKFERGMVLNFPNQLFMGQGKKEAIDEIRHEDDENSAFSMED